MKKEPRSSHPAFLALVILALAGILSGPGCSCSEECEPQCVDRECGDDGCGDVCGVCEDGYFCNDDFHCEPECVPDCDGKECGDDGCGDVCGVCEDGHICNEDFLCECVPDCEGKECGDDGCGGSCGVCEDNYVCNEDFLCECVPDCEGKECGDDGCGDVCGECSEGFFCDEEFICTDCTASCEGFCCGTDSCGDPCPDTCADGLICDPATCICSEPLCAIHPQLPECHLVTDPPGTSAETTAWILENIHPLACDDGYNFDILVRDFDDDTVFLFGEVHGTAELGHLSAALFEHLARMGLVSAMTLEIGMDMTEAIRTYIETGGGPLLTHYDYSSYSPDMFLRTLVDKARELHQDGVELNVYGSDIPVDMQWVNDEITDLVSDLDPDTRDSVLGYLPDVPSGGMLPESYFDEVDAYYDYMQGQYGEVCSELADADCEGLQMLVTGLWCGAFAGSAASMWASPTEWDTFFTRREPLITFNFTRQIETRDDRTYAHYGAAHTAIDATVLSGVPSVAHDLYSSHPPTQGSVYTTTYGNGPNSSIRYGGWIYDLDPEPSAVATAMSGAEHDAYWMSTNRPGQSCEEHPLLDEISNHEDLLYSEVYDAFTYLPQLTPERTARSTGGEAGLGARLEHMREVIAAAEMDMLKRRESKE